MTDTTTEQMCCNCQQPATHDFLDDEGEVHHLCATCHGAFLLGQHNYGYRTAVVNGIELCTKCRTAIFLEQDEFAQACSAGRGAPSWILEASTATAATATRRMRRAASASSRCMRLAPNWGSDP